MCGDRRGEILVVVAAISGVVAARERDGVVGRGRGRRRSGARSSDRCAIDNAAFNGGNPKLLVSPSRMRETNR